MHKNNKAFRLIFTLPIIIYVIFLVVLPILYIVAISFFKSDSYGGMITTITLENYKELFSYVYMKIYT